MTNNELLLSISDLIDTKLKPIDDRTKGLYPMLESIKQDQRVMKSDIKYIQADLKNVQLTLECEIKPRLDTIESCYLDTFHRYMMGAEELDAMKADMEIIKNVLSEKNKEIS